jgi:hypothetical protein
MGWDITHAASSPHRAVGPAGPQGNGHVGAPDAGADGAAGKGDGLRAEPVDVVLAVDAHPRVLDAGDEADELGVVLADVAARARGREEEVGALAVEVGDGLLVRVELGLDPRLDGVALPFLRVADFRERADVDERLALGGAWSTRMRVPSGVVKPTSNVRPLAPSTGTSPAWSAPYWKDGSSGRRFVPFNEHADDHRYLFIPPPDILFPCGFRSRLQAASFADASRKVSTHASALHSISVFSSRSEDQQSPLPAAQYIVCALRA